MLASTTKRVALGDGEYTMLEQWGEGGPVMLCVHGIGSSRKSWARTAEFFAASYRVFAYDQRGHGDSFDVPGPMTLERSLDDLAAVAATIGAPVQALLGHSWGGAVVLLGGRRIAPERVVAVDPMVHPPAGAWHADFVADLEPVLSMTPDARANVIREMFGALPTIEIDAKVHALRRMTIGPVAALGIENHADEGGWDLRPQLRGYPVPLLLLLADPSDSVVAPADVEFIRTEGGANVRIEVFEGEGHTLLRSAFERYAGAVQAFLDGRRTVDRGHIPALRRPEE